MAGQLLIYTPVITPRITYVFSLFFESLINISYKITTDIAEYKSHQGARLNYSDKPVETGEVFICTSGLLTEKDIHAQNILVTEWEGLKIFFQASAGAIPFDIFSASFYLVSRYEEYLPFVADKHGRFREADSLALKNGFINMPLVNLWAEKLKAILLKAYPDTSVTENAYLFTPTIDIDLAYAHKGRSIAVTLGSYAKALSKFDIGMVLNKTLTLCSLRPDDYDTYAFQKEIFKKYSVNPIYFILAAKRGDFDKNIATNGEYFSALIKELRFFANVGIHPSYQSANRKDVVKEEMMRVQKHLQGKITKSRQHFLRIKMPDTYRCLAEAGITDDYTMGYAGTTGFRASICTPFYFYDLQKEEQLNVKLHSTAIMDGTINEYMHLTPDEAIVAAKKLVAYVKQCQGEFVCIWHNHTVNDKGDWKGWKRVFETIMEAAA